MLIKREWEGKQGADLFVLAYSNRHAFCIWVEPTLQNGMVYVIVVCVCEKCVCG